MVRISGVDLPRNKRIDIGLTYIFGIGNTSAKKNFISYKYFTKHTL
jgi:small subunit ribosomal protein S13